MVYHSGRNFSLLTVGQFASIVGDRISTAVFISIAAAIIMDASSTTYSSIIIMCQTLPFLLFGYLFGLTADLVEKRKVLIFSDMARAGILILLYFYHESLIFLYFCVFGLGFFTALFDPAKKSIMPFLVRKDQLIFFNKFYAVIEILAMMIGLGFGAFLLSNIGIERALIFDASTYLFSMILLMFLSYRDESEVLKRSRKESFGEELGRHWKELKEGIRYLKKNYNMQSIIGNFVFFHFFAVAIFASSVLSFSVENFELGRNYLVGLGFGFENMLVGSHTTFIFLFVAIGALISPLAKVVIGKMRESTLSGWVFIFGGFSVFALVFVANNFSIMAFYPIFLVSMILMGLIVGVQYIRIVYLVHLNTDKKFMGRMISLTDIVWSLSLFGGMAVGAVISDIYGYDIGLLAGGVVYLIGGILLLRKRGRIDW
ncbi:MFS transporter [Methanococcoides sp. SA1]|nr:MFS transporter [Methanococcoides sp. SA1]